MDLSEKGMVCGDGLQKPQGWFSAKTQAVNPSRDHKCTSARYNARHGEKESRVQHSSGAVVQGLLTRDETLPGDQ